MKRGGERVLLRRREVGMLTSERPTIDPCILGSAIGDLFPEKPKIVDQLSHSNPERKQMYYYHESQDKHVDP